MPPTRLTLGQCPSSHLARHWSLVEAGSRIERTQDRQVFAEQRHLVVSVFRPASTSPASGCGLPATSVHPGASVPGNADEGRGREARIDRSGPAPCVRTARRSTQFGVQSAVALGSNVGSEVPGTMSAPPRFFNSRRCKRQRPSPGIVATAQDIFVHRAHADVVHALVEERRTRRPRKPLDPKPERGLIRSRRNSLPALPLTALPAGIRKPGAACPIGLRGSFGPGVEELGNEVRHRQPAGVVEAVVGQRPPRGNCRSAHCGNSDCGC